MDKHDIAAILEEMATLLELQGANPFRVRAYHNAARTIESLDDLKSFIKKFPLDTLPGIGKDLASKIMVIVKTGTFPEYEKLKKTTPKGLRELLQVGGLGAKKVKILFSKLGITTVEELEQALEKGKISELKGFGKKSQANLGQSVKKLKNPSKRMLWIRAQKFGEPLLKALKKHPDVIAADLAGSFRRKLETVGDFDFVIASKKPEKIIEWIVSQPLVAAVSSKGKTKATVQFFGGASADVRVVKPEEYPFALLYFTGSKEHSIKLRQRALALGFSLNEYGLKSLKQHLHSEKEIYNALGLDYIPPELREEYGEIDAAENGMLPHLIEEKDIKGILHCHTTYSDGHNTIEEMVEAAEKLGWEYIGISDHSKASYQAGGMDEKKLREQIKKIRALNSQKKYAPHIFAGLECDILEDGTLDFPNSVLKELDYVIVSVHRRYKQDERQTTARVIKAIENPYTTIVGHLTGRLLLHRDPVPMNIEKVIDAMIANNKIMEINGFPDRLDMDWRHWKRAKEKGLKCIINPDAHRTAQLLFYKTGVNIARKGWLEKSDVVNTLSLNDLKKIL